MKTTIGVFAHVDAGKTTFSEQILFKTNAIRKLGRVDHKDAFLDTHELEKKRGITIFSEQAYYTYKEKDYYLLDTPGHVDFSSEMERAIEVIDIAVMIISAIDGVQSHTETVYELLKEKNKAIVFFLNKIDAGVADVAMAIRSIKKLSPEASIVGEEDIELLLEHDDRLLEKYFEDSLLDSEIASLKEKLFLTSDYIPILKGSALKDEGIEKFLDFINDYSKTSSSDELLSGVCYKVRYDEKGVRQSFIKVRGGTIKTRDTIKDEKVTEIRRYQGKKYEVVKEASSGDLVALVGVELKVGEELTGDFVEYKIRPSLKSVVKFEAGVSSKDMYQSLLKIEDEDPTLQLEYNSHKEIEIGIMGLIQLEILADVIKERFGYNVTFTEPRIVYKETIRGSVIGCGHFEPLRHYAEVHLKIEENPNKGIEFINRASPDHLSVGNQNLIKHHLFEKEHRGILTGSGLMDLKITLLTGRAHKEHTSGGDFREATIRALRQGLEQAESVLLEPIYEAIITVPNELMGKVLSDITAASGECIDQISLGDEVRLKANVPVATFKDYPVTLASLTSGKGRIRMTVKSYQPCHNTEEVIEGIGYDKIRDTAYPSGSVFCSKGKGYTVTWEVAKEYMHCEV